MGRIGRCSLRLDPALFLAVGYLAWTLAQRYAVMLDLRVATKLHLTFGPEVWATLVAGGALVGLILHEAAHVFTTWLSGGRTRSLVLTFLGGRSEIEAPGRAAQVEWRSAVAGPLVSICLGLICLLARLRFRLNHADVQLALGDLGRFHLYFGVVNLVPAFPLDGGRAARALFARTSGVILATRMVSAIGKAIAIGCVVLAMHGHVLPLLFIAVYLYAGAVTEERHEWLASPIEGVAAGEACTQVAARAGVHELAAETVMLMQRSNLGAVPVIADDGATLAAVAIADLRSVPPRDLWTTTLGDLLPRLGRVVRVDADLARVRRIMIEHRYAAVAVVDRGGDAVGVLTIEAIERHISLYEIVAPAPAPALEPEPAPTPLPQPEASTPAV